MPEAGLVDEAESLLNEAKSCEEVSYVDAYMIANNTLVVENTAKREYERSYKALYGLLPLVN
jgi:hypothetical protein